MYTFSDALTLVRSGRRVARQSWINDGAFIFLVPGSTFTVNRAPLLGIYPEGTEITYRPHIDVRHADGTVGVFTPKQSDMLSDDWVVVGEESGAGEPTAEAPAPQQTTEPVAQAA